MHGGNVRAQMLCAVVHVAMWSRAVVECRYQRRPAIRWPFLFGIGANIASRTIKHYKGSREQAKSRPQRELFPMKQSRCQSLEFRVTRVPRHRTKSAFHKLLEMPSEPGRNFNSRTQVGCIKTPLSISKFIDHERDGALPCIHVEKQEVVPNLNQGFKENLWGLGHLNGHLDGCGGRCRLSAISPDPNCL